MKSNRELNVFLIFQRIDSSLDICLEKKMIIEYCGQSDKAIKEKQFSIAK